MQIVRDLAGYSYGGSDNVRRAMSKKKLSVMQAEREKFVHGSEAEGIKGCVANGISEDVANRLWDQMMSFAAYAFNKSHAAAYAMVAYQTAYLKAHFPFHFMAAMMTSYMESKDKFLRYLTECKKQGIKILPPDVNESGYRFMAAKYTDPETGETQDVIRYGLVAIKGVGGTVVDEIVEEREKNGPYKSLKDLCVRLPQSVVNKKTIEALIKSGAIDSLPGTRLQKMHVHMQVIDATNAEKKTRMSGQLSLFDMMEPEEQEVLDISFPDVGEYPKGELLAFEKEIIGFYISGHPLDDDMDYLKDKVTRYAVDFSVSSEDEAESEAEPKAKDDEQAVIAGIVTKVTVKTTKSNQIMAFLTMEDMTGDVEVIVFPKQYEQYRMLLAEDRKLMIRGRVSHELNRDAKLISSVITCFDERPKMIWVRFATVDEYKAREAELIKAIDAYDGQDLVTVYIADGERMKRLSAAHATSACEMLLAKLRDLFGGESVIVKDA